jgi:hypothetical protein
MSGKAARNAFTTGSTCRRAEHDGRCNGEIAARRKIFAGRGALGLGDLLQDLAGCCKIGLAGVGQGQLAGGADQQARMEMRFELGHLAADRRQRHTEAAASGGEASGLDRGYQDRHRVQTVQLPSHFLRE